MAPEEQLDDLFLGEFDRPGSVERAGAIDVEVGVARGHWPRAVEVRRFEAALNEPLG